MKTLLLLRHAKSSWKESELADHDRPLKKRGQRDAPRAGRLIVEHELAPDAILSSTAARARETTELVAEAASFAGEIRFEAGLYPGEPDAILALLRLLSDEISRVLIVGHNPGLEELVSLLTGREEPLPTAALAQVTLPIDHWAELSRDTRGELENVWRPRELEEGE